MNEPSLIATSRSHKVPMRLGQVARVCHLSKKTVINYINRGVLPAYRTKGNHWRVWPGDLSEFIRKNHLNVQFKFVETRLRDVLIIDHLDERTKKLSQIIRLLKSGTRVTTTSDGHDAMFHLGHKSPQMIIAHPAINLPLQTMLTTVAAHHGTNQPMVIISTRAIDHSNALQLKAKFPAMQVHVIPEHDLNTNIMTLLRRA